MDPVTAWLGDGKCNSENFYVDDELTQPPEGHVPISVGGIFTFVVLMAPPHTISFVRPPTSPALRRFLQLTAGMHGSVAVALTAATKAYLSISDALDAENADDDDEGTQEDDTLERAALAGRTAAEAERRRQQIEMDAQFERVKTQFDVSRLPKPCVDRILSDYAELQRTKHFGWKAAPDGRNLALWNVEFFDFDKGTSLEKDMREVAKRTGKNAVELVMKFPPEYPFKPPFIRVVRPRFELRTGRVTVGGSICTQLLTEEGWKPVFDIESILETIRQQITDKESGAKIDHSNCADYTEAEALEAFTRVAEHHRTHGW